MASTDRHKTAFAGLLFRSMPFSIQGAPGTFQRMMDSLIQGLSSYTAAYLDNLVIFSTSWKEHIIKHLGVVMERLRSAGLIARPKKCQFGMARCLYLGHVVGSGTVHPEESKIEAVRSFPTPETKKELRAFLGLTGYYRKFIKDYSMMCPLPPKAEAFDILNLTAVNFY